MRATASLLSFCLLQSTHSYWPTARGDVNSARSAASSGPSALGAPLASELLPRPVDGQVRVGAEGNVYAIAGSVIFALDGQDLHQLWSYPFDAQQAAPPSLQPQPDGTLFLGGVGLFDSNGNILSPACRFW